MARHHSTSLNSTAPLIKDYNEDDGVRYNHEDSLLKTQYIHDQLFATFAVSHFVKLASARSHGCRPQKDNQRQLRERRKQPQR